MTKTIDYYFSVNSPWTYLGHARFVEIARRAGAHVAVKPVDMARVFAASGGLPVAQRPRQRQLYRMAELRRWRAHLGIPIHLRDLNALALVGFLGRAVWEEERDVSDPATLKAIVAEHGRNAELLWEAAQSPEVATAHDAYTQEAIDREVFGAPTYAYRDELFWGQDRLDFLERALAG